MRKRKEDEPDISVVLTIYTHSRTVSVKNSLWKDVQKTGRLAYRTFSSEIPSLQNKQANTNKQTHLPTGHELTVQNLWILCMGYSLA